MRKFLLLIIFVLSLSSIHAHIGSPDIIYEGNAGPYSIYTIIQAPDVVPGIAKVYVSFPDGKKRKVKIQPIYYQYGDKGAPPADQIISVEGTTGEYLGQLWLMSFGSSSVKITIEGEKGFGATIVPVPAVATATRKMEPVTSIVLAILGLFLFFSMITIIGASVGEATLNPGMALSVIQKRKVRMVMTVVGVALAVGLFFANKWWNAVEGQYKKNMFKPLTLKSSIGKEEKESLLRLVLTNNEWLNRKISDLVPDHGKIMHLFLVDKGKTFFAHLHPIKEDSSLFTTKLPSLHPGEYHLFADIVHMDGMTETLTDTLIIPSPIINNTLLDSDDSWILLNNSGNKLSLDKDLVMITEFPKDIRAGNVVDLKIKVQNNKGEILEVQPYLGMSGHAVVMKTDGKVFIHLHPMGTISMVSQYALSNRVQGDVSICGVIDSNLARIYDTLGVYDNPRLSIMKNKVNKESSYAGNLSFPYVFPSAGKYKCWVQVKRTDKIHTGVFEITVN